VLDAVARVRAANPEALYCCDPVIGDGGRVYVRDGIPALIAERAVPEADVLTPNQFELERLSGVACVDAAAVRRAIGVLRGRMRPGRRAVLLTSVATGETPAGALDIVAADDHGMQTVRVPALTVAASGAGDMMAALFLFHLLRTGQAGAAMAAAASAVHAVLTVTAAQGGRDLRLVEAQESIVAPGRVFQAHEF
jgi:pyridoxine kinase